MGPSPIIVIAVSILLSVRFFLQPDCYTKATPVLALAALSASGASTFSYSIAAGLVLSSVGDVYLQLEDEALESGLKEGGYFIAGVVFFLSAHIAYTVALSSDCISYSKGVYVAMGLVAYYICLMAALLPQVETELIAPVSVYGLVILAMLFVAINRYLSSSIDSPSHSSKVAALFGSIVFVVSDTALAVNKFRLQFPHAHLVVMITYYIAQTLIACSALSTMLAKPAVGDKKRS